MSKPQDLMGTYISQVLIPRLNRADELYMKGRQYEALRAQLSVVRVLYRETDDDKKILLDWIEQVEGIKTKSEKVGGEFTDIESYNKERFRNFMAEKLYPRLDMSIWDKLHELQYFAGRKRYGLTEKELNELKAVEI